MTTTRFRRTLPAIFCLVALLGWSSAAWAQMNTFIIPLERVGTPGTTEVVMLDPLTLEPVTVVVDTGALVNPCTGENVDVTGNTTINTILTVDRFSTLRVTVSAFSRGAGLGWVPDATGAQVFSGQKYTFNDSQQFTFRLPAAGEEFSSDFSDKLSLMSQGLGQNWMVRVHFRIKVDAAGAIVMSLIKITPDVCKG